MALQTHAPANPAEAYERIFVPTIFAAWAEDLLRRAAPQPGERVLDVACGTGIVARLAAPLVGSTGAVIGVDLNPGMLAIARTAAAAEGAAIEWREGRGEALPVEDAAFDLVCCQQGLQVVEDRGAGLREMRRALVPGGRLAVSVWQGIAHHPIYADLDELVDRHFGMRALAQSMFSLGDGDELRRLLREAGYRDVTIEPASLTARLPDPGAFVQALMLSAAWALPEVRQMDAAARDALMAAALPDVEVAVRRYVDNGEVVFPYHAHVTRARA
ncbi:MAG: class I SAM-dependent methyltransferase [Thermomicrobiales bacterium]